MRQGNLSLKIDVERAFAFYRQNLRLVRAMVALRDPAALRIVELVGVANQYPDDEQNLVNACLGIEEWRRCLLN